MNDETRDEIVRLARKGWPAEQIIWLSTVNWPNHCAADELVVEQVQQVIDEQQTGITKAFNERRDAIGRIAKWLDEAREMGYGSRDIARMLGEVYVGPAPGRAAGSVEELADLLDEMAKGVPTYEQLQAKAGELFVQAFKLAEQAQELVAPTPDEFNTAIQMVNEMYSDVSEDRPDLGTADGLWDVLDQVMETRRAIAEDEYSA